MINLRPILDLHIAVKEKDKEIQSLCSALHKMKDKYGKERLKACIDRDKEELKILKDDLKILRETFIDKKITFPKNDIGGLHDHNFFRGIPEGIEFTITGFPSDWVNIRAYGYGILDSDDKGSYGSGSLAPSLRGVVEFFESLEGIKKKRDYKRMWGDLKQSIEQKNPLLKIIEKIEDEYE